MKALSEIRKEIDQCDHEIKQLLVKRMHAVSTVADIKKQNGIKILDSKREKEILDEIEKEDIAFAKEIKEIYKHMMDVSKQYQIERLMPQKIFLIGYMGVGKTTLGKMLSKVSNIPFYDLDQKIEKIEKIKINDFFAEKGESAFRDLETKHLEMISHENKFIVSCGGGIVLKEENRKILKEKGVTVFLTGNMKLIYKRINSNNKRPLVVSDRKSENPFQLFLERYEAREPLYLESCHLTFNPIKEKSNRIARDKLFNTLMMGDFKPSI